MVFFTSLEGLMELHVKVTSTRALFPQIRLGDAVDKELAGMACCQQKRGTNNWAHSGDLVSVDDQILRKHYNQIQSERSDGSGALELFFLLIPRL